MVPTSPGVYAVELPAGVRAIAGASTSVTGFLGRALRGPADRAVRVTSIADFDRVFGGLWFDSPLGYMVHAYFRNGGVEASIARLAPGATPATVSLPAAGLPNALNLAAASPGEWGRSLRVTVTAAGGRFALTLQEIDPALPSTDPGRVLRQEVHIDLGVTDADPRRVDRVLAASSQLAVVTQRSGGLPNAAADQAFTGGGHGAVPGAADYDAGMVRLAVAGGVNLLCIAGPARQTEPPNAANDVPAAVWGTAATWCEGRRATVLVDPPTSWSSVAAAAAKTGLTAITSGNAALYYPNVVVADPLRSGRPMTLGPSASVAGVIARTDGSRGLWKAPAGLDAGLVGLASLGASLTESEGGQLNSVGVNALRSFSDTGPVVWGARTAAGADTRASQWKYLPVRRLALYIEQSLVDGLQWVVFEPNDEKLWAQIRLNVGAFLQGLFRQGAFQGARASDAYFVKCDAETTQPADVNRGVVNVMIGFAPLKPAEFVILQFQQILRAA